MTEGLQAVLIGVGVVLMLLAVIKAWRMLRRKHKPGAKNNWVNEAYSNRHSSNTWEKEDK